MVLPKRPHRPSPHNIEMMMMKTSQNGVNRIRKRYCRKRRKKTQKSSKEFSSKVYSAGIHLCSSLPRTPSLFSYKTDVTCLTDGRRNLIRCSIITKEGKRNTFSGFGGALRLYCVVFCWLFFTPKPHADSDIYHRRNEWVLFENEFSR